MLIFSKGSKGQPRTGHEIGLQGLDLSFRFSGPVLNLPAMIGCFKVRDDPKGS